MSVEELQRTPRDIQEDAQDSAYFQYLQDTEEQDFSQTMRAIITQSGYIPAQSLC